MLNELKRVRVALLCAVLAVFAIIGWLLAGSIDPAADSVVSRPSTAMSTTSVEPALGRGSDTPVRTGDTLNRLLGLQQGDPSSRDDLSTSIEDALANDARLRTELLQRFLNDSDEPERRATLHRLTQDPGPQAVAFGRDLLASADAGVRRHGHELLLAVLETQDTQQPIAEALAKERDSSVLRAVAIAMAKAEDAPAETSDALRQQLRALSTHPDIAVQAAGLRALSRWDRSPHADAALRQALSDPRPELREAAMSSLEGDPQRVQALKPELMAVARNAADRPDLRGVALGALRSSPLGLDEAIELRRIERELAAVKARTGPR